VEAYAAAGTPPSTVFLVGFFVRPELDAKFKDLSLGLVDGTVAALAERRKVYRVLTTDRRDFSAIRVGPRLSQVLELPP
jgi:hypothetical protein